MPTIEQFGEYGLAGLVIFTLFTACFMVVRWIFKHVGDLATQHHDERNEWRSHADRQMNLHRDERSEWRDEINNITTLNAAAVERVVGVINENIAKIAQDDLNRSKGEENA